MERIISHPRGAIYFVNIDFNTEDTKGVQTGNRPCVIISSNTGNASSDSVVVALITSKDKQDIGINVPFVNWNGEENVILCNQVHTVSKKWLTNKCFGMLPPSVMKEVDKQLSLAMGIPRNSVDISEITRAINQLIEVKKAELKAEKQGVTQKVVNNIAEQVKEMFNDDKSVESVETAESVIESSKEEVISKNNENTEEVTKVTKVTKVTEKSDKKSEDKKEGKYPKKPYGFWTVEKMKEFIHDKETLPLSVVKEKWEIEKTPTLYQLYYSYKKKLGLS